MVDRFIPFFLVLLAASLPVSIAATHIFLGTLLLLGIYQLRVVRIPRVRTPMDQSIGIFLLLVLMAALVGYSPTKSLVSLVSFWHIVLYLMVPQWVRKRPLAHRLIAVLLDY